MRYVPLKGIEISWLNSAKSTRQLMFENKWTDTDAASIIASNGAKGINKDLALRVYTSRLIGNDPDLVMHGGGNTSCKTMMPDLFGRDTRVLCVKGSGWDLGTIEAPGLPAVRLEPLLALRSLESLGDQDMVNVQRSNLMDQSAPNPSVETLLHAFLPHKFVDHTHATPFLALANLPDPKAIIQEIFGDSMAVVPYVMPGFALAKLAASIAEEHPEADGLVLLKHGHFTWGEDAKSSYDRVIDHTIKVEEWFAAQRDVRQYPAAQPPIADIFAQINMIKKAFNKVSAQENTSFVMDWVDDQSIVAQMNKHIADGVIDRGVATPDHVIRIKAKPLVLSRTVIATGLDAVVGAIENFIADYKQYFDTWSTLADEPKTMLDPMPKIIWVETLGLIGVGATKTEAKTITDLGAQNIRVITDAENAGGFYPVADKDLFDMEYWSLEQAKLGKAAPPPLQGKVTLVTGAGGTIGAAIVRAFDAAGAEVVAIDKDNDALIEKRLPARVTLKQADLTDEDQINAIINDLVLHYGGVDILVSNAGTAPQASLLEMKTEILYRSFDINFFAHFHLAKAVGILFVNQGNKGQMLFNISKQAINPGRNFGAYGLPKAALMFLVKQLALELGEHGVRVNGVNADRIRSGILDSGIIANRAEARGISEDEYMKGNLLRQEVEARHVANAFLHLTLSDRTTGHVMTVDGGNIEASLR